MPRPLTLLLLPFAWLYAGGMAWRNWLYDTGWKAATRFGTVPVISVGQEGFPAFFTRESGFKADFRLDSADEQAAFISTKWQLGLSGGVVVSNPVPAAQAMPKEEIDAITTQALQEADAGH